LDAKENIEKKAKNLLGRLQMMHTINVKIKPTPDIVIPFIPGNYPASWWREKEDRDLLIGVLTHGYGKYEMIRYDPTLCFYDRYVDKQGNHKMAPEVVEVKLPTADSVTDLNSSLTDLHDVPMDLSEGTALSMESSHTTHGPSNPSNMTSLPADVVDTKSIEPVNEPSLDSSNTLLPKTTLQTSHNGESTTTVHTGASNDAGVVIVTDGTTPEEWFHWPSPSEIGVRLRKIIAAFNRIGHTKVKDNARHLVALNKQKQKTLKEIDLIKSKEHHLSRKDKIEFIRVVMSYGMEYDLRDLETRVWGRFKDLSSLKKSNDTLNEHYLKLFELAHEVIERGDILHRELKEQESRVLLGIEGDVILHSTVAIKSLKDLTETTAEPAVADPQESVNLTKFNPNAYRIENDGDILAYEKAKRMLKRIEVMRTLREVVLTHPDLDNRLLPMRRHQRSILPEYAFTCN